MHTRLFAGFAIALVGLAAFAATGSKGADEWPSKPIRVIVPLSPGSAADIVPRIVFEQVGQQLEQTAVIENRAGASGTIAGRAVATADADGYTLMAHSTAHVIAPATFANIPYDAIKDFAPIVPLANVPLVLVVAPSKNIKTIQELVALGKKQPLTFGSIGVGSPVHLAWERFRLSAGFQAQAIPFKGAPEAVLETVTGRIDAYMSPVSTALPLIRDGKLLALAVTSPQRVASLPDVPTTEEAGYKNSAYQFWIGMFAPAKTPAPIVARLATEIQKALQVPSVRERFAELGVQPMTMNTAEFTQFVKDELALNAGLTKAAGLTPQ
ncbi:MAG: tripartite tricarboxylate transporter substrate binding protein [Pseudolabrys sp.]|nr:tripartite tricarboxylate transporter substrate binding protein [Pseudolabrys sp.]